MNQRARWVGVGAAAALLLGSLLPWATGPFGIAVSGTSGDGVLTIVLSAPLAVFAWFMPTLRWAAVLTCILGVMASALMLYEVVHISGIAAASIGIGVIVCLAASLAAVGAGAVCVRRQPVAAAAVPPTAPPVVSPDGNWLWDGARWVPLQRGQQG